MCKRILLIVVVALFSFALASGNHPTTPRKNEEKKIEPKKPDLPDLSMQCQFGRITQEGRSIEIAGNPSWSALGVLRDDGKLQIIWTRNETLHKVEPPMPDID